MKDDTEYYTYDELKKSRLPGFMFSGVAIRTSWIRRCRRYAVHKGLNIELLGRFIKKRLSDRNEADFREQSLIFDGVPKGLMHSQDKTLSK